MRYFLLETIRQYAREKLFEAKQAAAVRDRHFVHFKNGSSGLWDVSRFTSEAEMQKLKSMQVEVENLRAAFEWGLQNDVQGALELAANMAMSMTMVGGLIEGTTILKMAMEKFRALPPVEGAENRLRKEIYAHGCFGLGTLLQGSNEIMSSRSALQEAIAIARELGDKKLLGVSLEMYANAWIRRVYHVIAQQNCKRLGPDERLCTEEHMPESECGSLTNIGELDVAELVDLLQKPLLACTAEFLLKLVGGIEVVFNRPFVLACNDDELFDAGGDALLNSVLDHRLVDNRKNLLG